MLYYSISRTEEQDDLIRMQYGVSIDNWNAERLQLLTIIEENEPDGWHNRLRACSQLVLRKKASKYLF